MHVQERDKRKIQMNGKHKKCHMHRINGKEIYKKRGEWVELGLGDLLDFLRMKKLASFPRLL